ncbi:DUF6932 family protein [Brevundimonas poindexterae]|uniref:DUF6932 family protein n=1 Tax=Brevundimonas poindexterae TaxID=74325 RepID=UPI001CFCCD29|nr:hypothetical protein [Brevundimonas poindexterae]
MIPAFNSAGIIPPYLTAAGHGDRSPYESTIVELVERFGFSPERRRILRGLIGYRAALAAGGFAEGYQLIDGSFVEDCEALRNRPPGDVDVLSYLAMPAHYSNDINAYQNEGIPFLVNEMLGHAAKQNYSVDAYLAVNPPGMSLSEFFHIFSHFTLLFSHQKQTDVWKGAISIPFDLLADTAAMARLDEMEQANG